VWNRLDGRDSSYRKTRKFYVMAQFSRFIRPGSQIISASDDDSLVAYDRAKQQLIIVAVNDRNTSRDVTYRLDHLTAATTEVTAYRTSQQEDVAPQPVVTLADGKFSANLPARSVTTFIVPTAIPDL
jgi:O-glycosyl hydrolase